MPLRADPTARDAVGHVFHFIATKRRLHHGQTPHRGPRNHVHRATMTIEDGKMADSVVEKFQVFLSRRVCAADGKFPIHVRLDGIAEPACEQGTAGIAIGKKPDHRAIGVHDKDDALDAAIEAHEHVFQRRCMRQDVVRNIGAYRHSRKERAKLRCSRRVSELRR